MPINNNDKHDMALVIDDEMDICWSIEYILNKNGFYTVVATNARDALAALGSNKFNFVLIDAMLPDMDGLELARHIHNAVPHTRIVMISGYFYEDDVSVQQAIGQGLINAFISKPFLQEEIVRVLGRLNAETAPCPGLPGKESVG
jgi:DNA-binding NtrC family response regulator